MGNRTTYSWDIENRMTLAELSDATLNTITYDGDGKRRQYEDSAGLRKFIWDEENIFRQTDSGGTTNRDYTYNPQYYGEMVSQSGLFHHYDALGSTDRLTDASENVDTSYLYRAFGEQTILSGSDPNRFTWVGRLGYYRQPDTGDYWVRARVYEPQMGRWRRRDPLCLPRPAKGWPSPAVLSSRCYPYGNGDPLGYVDPSGLSCEGRRKCQDIEPPRGWISNRPHSPPNQGCDCAALAVSIDNANYYWHNLDEYCSYTGSSAVQGSCAGMLAWTYPCKRDCNCLGRNCKCGCRIFFCPSFWLLSGCQRRCALIHETTHCQLFGVPGESGSNPGGLYSCQVHEGVAFESQLGCMCRQWRQRNCGTVPSGCAGF